MTVTITEIEPSNRKNKRYKAILSNGNEIHFGLKGASTYIDNNDTTKRNAYIARHYGNKREQYLIDNLILSPSLLSAYLLWGHYDNLNDNLKYLNKLLIKK